MHQLHTTAMVKKGDLLLCRAVDTSGHNYFLRDEDRICRYVIITSIEK